MQIALDKKEALRLANIEKAKAAKKKKEDEANGITSSSTGAGTSTGSSSKEIVAAKTALDTAEAAF
jgi:hypothetical protein